MHSHVCTRRCINQKRHDEISRVTKLADNLMRRAARLDCLRGEKCSSSTSRIKKGLIYSACIQAIICYKFIKIINLKSLIMPTTSSPRQNNQYKIKSWYIWQWYCIFNYNFLCLDIKRLHNILNLQLNNILKSKQ